MDTNIIQHHFVMCTIKYTHVCIRHAVQTSVHVKRKGTFQGVDQDTIRIVEENEHVIQKIQRIFTYLFKMKMK
jgi:hypothetical protein